MSLLLDARKKSQLAQDAQAGGLAQPTAGQGAEAYSGAAPADGARAAGLNLFNAKASSPSLARSGNVRVLLIALGGTVVLLLVGVGYVWHVVSDSNVRQPPLRRISPPAPAQQNNLVPGIVPETPAASEKTPAGQAAPAQSKQTAKPARNVWAKSWKAAKASRQQTRKSPPMLVEHLPDEPLDPILNNAYLAYRDGKFEQAQQLYQQVLRLDERNSDALLGMAAIAQRRGEDDSAAHYYAKALALDPRNAVANAGMSALTTDDNRESRLKNLLDEQRDSPSLHFALGNQYAEQQRWGEAQQAYFDAYKLEPDNAELAFNLAVSLEHLGRKKLAATYYQRAMQLDQSLSAGFDHALIVQRIEELLR